MGELKAVKSTIKAAAKKLSGLADDAASRVARAAEQGYEGGLYHATKSNIDPEAGFKSSHGGTYFSGDLRDVEPIFSGEYSGGTSEYFVRKGNTFDARWKNMGDDEKDVLRSAIADAVDRTDIEGAAAMLGVDVEDIDPLEVFADGEFYHGFGRSIQNSVLENLKRKGYDSVVFPDSLVLGDDHVSTVVFDPSRIRLPEAAFDPAKIDSPNLLAGLGGAAVLGGSLAPEDAEAGPKNVAIRLSKYADEFAEYAKKMPYAHNAEPNRFDIRERRYGMHKEPAGQYITPIGSVPDDPPINAYMQYGEKQFNKPLVIDFGATDYDKSTNWKRRLSRSYGGKTGKELTDALRADGYDSVLTVDRYGNPSEAVDLYKGKGGVDMPTLAQGAIPITALTFGGAALAPQDAEAGPMRVLSHIDEAGNKVYKTVIDAWHGSPHSFDKFDISKIGTGEGAQAYGHGLYFADSQDVARGYRDTLTPRDKLEFPDGRKIFLDDYGADFRHKAAADYLGAADGDYAKARQQIKETGGAYKNEYLDVIDEFESQGIKVPQGAIYRTEIDVDPDTLLDWDKPLSEQNESVQSALRAVVENAGGDWEKVRATNWTGGEFERQWYGEYSRDETASKLLDAGIPGIRYRDGFSRGDNAAEGTYNYVLFDDKPIKITERGSADPALLGATAAATLAGGFAISDEDMDRYYDSLRVRGALGEFQTKRQEKRVQYDERKRDLLETIGKYASLSMDALDKPLQGYLGLAGVAGSLAAGNGIDAALQQGATIARQPSDQTTYNLGGAVTDATGSPLLGAAVHTGLLMGSPL